MTGRRRVLHEPRAKVVAFPSLSCTGPPIDLAGPLCFPLGV